MILIVTEKFDPHADLVSQELKKRKLAFQRIHLSDFPLHMSVNYGFGLDQQDNYIINWKKKIPLSDVRSVWYRRTEWFEFPKTVKRADALLARRECAAAIKGLWHILSDRKWISVPERAQHAENKIVQLTAALEIGFRTVPTCFSNDAIAVKEFHRKHLNEKIVYKTFTPVLVPCGKKVEVIYTTIVDNKMIGRIQDIRCMPGIFQVLIPKTYELRVTIFGKHLFACKVHSQDSAETITDVRATTWGKQMPKHEIIDIPTRLRKMCFALTSKLGLNYAAIDLVYGVDSCYYFLELNPNGQWAWIQELTNAPMSTALVETLTSA